MDALIGQTLDQYQIVSLLGEGGMGAVYRARDVGLQRDAAVKVMHAQFARQRPFQERFQQEARAVARLDHPGIVKVYGFGHVRDVLYIAMEFIPGANLRQLLKDLRMDQKWIVLPEAVQLVRQVCLAMHYVHRQGVLHRDLKPDNLMLKNEPGEGLPYRPVLTDLGLAKLQSGGLQTQDGTSMGTPAYMSPEQALGQPTDARSDIYSLGVLLYELAVGRLPFPVMTLSDAIRAHTQEPPPPPRSLRPDLPVTVERAILTALAKNPAQRYSDAAAFAQALGDVLPATQVSIQPPTAAASLVSLGTQYQKSVGADRGPSILKEFHTPPGGLVQDQLQILMPDHTTRSVAVKPGGLSIGRGAGNDVVLDLPLVSKNHARLEFDGADYRITDLDSTNGTFLANVKLLGGIPERWPPGQALQIGGCWLHVVRAPAAASRAGGTQLASGALQQSAAGGVGLALQATELSVEPGGRVACEALVVNQGTLVDHFVVTLQGLPPGWAAPAPPLQLLPGTTQTVSLLIQPPRSPASRAGDYPLTVSAASQSTPSQAAVARLTLKLAPFAEFRSDLRPQKVLAGRPAQISLENLGNTAQKVGIEWRDRGDELAFTPPQAQVEVAAGQSATVAFQAVPRQQRLRQPEKSYSFSAQVNVPGLPPQVHAGELVSPRRFPYWLAAVALVVLCLCLALLSLGAVFLLPILFPPGSGPSLPGGGSTSAPPVATPAPAAPSPTPEPAIATEAPAPGRTTQPSDTHSGELVIAMPAPINLDPALARSDTEVLLANLAYDYLLDIDAQGNATPRLATSWEPGDGGLSYIFHLASGVTFHDGSPFSAQDVVWTFNRLRDSSLAGPTPRLLSAISSISAVDDQTVQFQLSQPDPFFLYHISDDRAVILKAGSPNPTDFNGTGPFKVTRYSPSERVELAAFDQYFIPGQPQLAKLTITFPPNEDAGLAALRNAQADAVMGLSAGAYASLAADQNLSRASALSNSFDVIRIRTDHKPFDDPRILRALRVATDRQALFDVAQQGLGAVGSDSPIGPLFAANFSPDTSLAAPDADQARALLQDAGYPDGLDLSLTIPDTPGLAQFAQELKRQWDAAGLRLTINQEPESAYYGQGHWLQVDLGVTRWPSSPYPQFYLESMFRTGAPWNESHWSAEEFDRLLNAAALGNGDYRDDEKYLRDGGPVIIPYFRDQLAVTSSRVGGFQLSPSAGRTDFRVVSVSP